MSKIIEELFINLCSDICVIYKCTGQIPAYHYTCYERFCGVWFFFVVFFWFCESNVPCVLKIQIYRNWKKLVVHYSCWGGNIFDVNKLKLNIEMQ